MDVVSLSNALGLVGGVREQGGWLVRSVRRLARQPKDEAPGDWATRKVAYHHFGDAAMVMAQDLYLLTAMGTPPSLRGALWSWPTVVRVNRRSYDRFHETLSALLEISLVGDQAVLAAAATAAEALGGLAAMFPTGRGGGAVPADFAGQYEDTTEKLGDFVTAARADLRKKD